MRRAVATLSAHASCTSLEADVVSLRTNVHYKGKPMEGQPRVYIRLTLMCNGRFAP